MYFKPGEPPRGLELPDSTRSGSRLHRCRAGSGCRVARVGPVSGLVLQREDRDESMYGGGTVAYRAYVAGRWVGWFGDGREWRGWRYGGRKWWACWREDGDTAARWNTELEFGTRAAAIAALLARVGSDSFQ